MSRVLALVGAAGAAVCASARAEELNLDAAYEIMKGTRPVFSAPSTFTVEPAVAPPAPATDSAPSFGFTSLTLTPPPAAGAVPAGAADTALDDMFVPRKPAAAPPTGGTEPSKRRICGTMTSENGTRFTVVQDGDDMTVVDSQGRARLSLHRQDSEHFFYEQIDGTLTGSKIRGTMQFEALGAGGRLLRFNARGKPVESYTFTGTF